MTETINTTENQPVRAIMGAIIDYAGMYPPARLSLDQSLFNYRMYSSGSFSWMLGRFVCPYSELQKIEHILEANPLAEKLPISVVSPVTGSDHAGLREVLGEISSINQQSDTVCIEAIELKLDSESEDHVAADIHSLLNGVDEKPYGLKDIFVEIPVDRVSVIDEIGRVLNEHDSVDVRIALKLRTGGVTPEAFPSSGQIASFIAACHRSGLAFKLTAGLHHPFRHYRDSVSTRMHGFINVLIAAAAASSGAFDEKMISEILEDEDAANFRFERESVVWNGHEVTLGEIGKTRSGFAVSIGSCSFDEPLEDLQTLKLIPQ
ncbi:MAG: hypothetical protein HKN43_04450 [Rhodothermales bacterium]|nr:hypothetical protein [Rhodothermales bacterium]